jgi:hypothetical protein
MRNVQVIEKMVARDGVEPPTPAFSGLDSLIPIPFIFIHFADKCLPKTAIDCSQNAAINCGYRVCLTHFATTLQLLAAMLNPLLATNGPYLERLN